MLIDIAISGDGTVVRKDAESNLKQKDLTTEKQRVWNVSLINPLFVN
jgi:hypothetical protein